MGGTVACEVISNNWVCWMLAVLALTIKDQDWGVWGRKNARCGPESCDYGSDHPDPCRLNKEERSRERWVLWRETAVGYWQLRGQTQRQTGSWRDAQRVATLFSLHNGQKATGSKDSKLKSEHWNLLSSCFPGLKVERWIHKDDKLGFVISNLGWFKLNIEGAFSLVLDVGYII